MAQKEKKQRDPNNPRLHIGKFFAWKSSDISAAGVNWILSTYMLVFCTNALGMDPVLAGSLILISNVIDAVTDLVVGYLIDITPFGKLGKCRPYELGILGMTVFTAVLFCCPNISSNVLKCVWVFVVYTMIFGVFNTARGGAQFPYMVRAFDNNRQLIGKVSAYGGIVTTMGAAMVTLSFPRLIKVFGSETAAGLSADGWKKLILLYMIPLTVIAVFRFLFVKENPAIDAGQQRVKITLKDILAMLKCNPYVWAYGIMILAFNIVQNLGANAYYFDYVVGDQAKLGTLSLFSYFMMPFMFLMPFFLKRFGAAKMVWFTAILAVLGYALNFFAGANMGMLIGGAVLTAFLMLPISYLGNVLLVNIVNYTEYKGLPRQDALTTALASGVFSQLGQGLGPFFVGVLLKASGYKEAVAGTVAAQPDSAVFMIRCLYSLVPLLLVVFVIIGSVVLAKLEKKMPEIEPILEERRAQIIAEKANKN